MNPVAKALVVTGTLLVLLGLIWQFWGGQIPLGRLPGDIHIKREHSSFYFPITTSIVISLVLSLAAYLFRR
jgi:hypothetical protein